MTLEWGGNPVVSAALARASAGEAPVERPSWTAVRSSQASSSGTVTGAAITESAPACSQTRVMPRASSPQRTEERPSSHAERITVRGTRG